MDFELKNGIVITVEWDAIEPPDPEVGIFGPFVNGFWITHVGARKCSAKVADWLYERLSARDVEAIERKIVEEYY